MSNHGDIVREGATRRQFIDELLNVPGGERVHDCIQCGTCSGSCPVSYAMDNGPRKLMAMIRAGMRDEVLGSESIWQCSSCYMCTLRCPKKIAITDIMYALKRIAMSEGKARGEKTAAMAELFVAGIEKNGRNSETGLLMRYYLKTDPFGMFRKAPLGMRLMMRGRMPLRGERIKDIDQIRAIIAKTQEMGGIK